MNAHQVFEVARGVGIPSGFVSFDQASNTVFFRGSIPFDVGCLLNLRLHQAKNLPKRLKSLGEEIAQKYEDQDFVKCGELQAEINRLRSQLGAHRKDLKPNVKVNIKQLDYHETSSPSQAISSSAAAVDVPEMRDSELTEHFDSPEVFKEKCDFLIDLIRNSKHLVVFTGAGISTACKIPDFRGPDGAWTRRDRGLAPPKCIDLAQAIPSKSHMALVALQSKGIMKYLTSQNIDGLHKRSGVSTDLLSELHGNAFLEICADCKREYPRPFDTTQSVHKRIPDPLSTSGISHITGRTCKDCGGNLRDSIIHFTEALPEDHLNRALDNFNKADLALCLGSSLRVSPACDLPGMTVHRNRGKIVIVNLQRTPKDKFVLRNGGMLIHARIDDVMEIVMKELGLEIPKPQLVTLEELETEFNEDILKAEEKQDEQQDESESFLMNSVNDFGGAAVALESCPHVKNAVREIVVGEALPLQGAECSIEGCYHTETWVCLTCYKVFCGRYAAGHCSDHCTGCSASDNTHSVAIGLGDLGFWCYRCDSYLHHLKIPDIFNVYNAFHIAKFGTPAESALQQPKPQPSSHMDVDTGSQRGQKTQENGGDDAKDAPELVKQSIADSIMTTENRGFLAQQIEDYTRLDASFTDARRRAEEASKYLPWNCSSCSFENDQYPSICEVCETSNPLYHGGSFLNQNLVDSISQLLYKR